MPEVLVEVESEHSAHADRHIGIAREIEINLHCIDDDGIPCSCDGNRGSLRPEELIDDHGEMICENDLFAETDHQAREALAQVEQRGFAVFDLICDCGIADNRSGDELRKHRDIEQQMKRILLNVDLLPVEVNDIGEDLERIEADADRQCQVRNGQTDAGDQVKVLDDEAAVLEHAEQPDIKDQAEDHNELGAALFFALLAAADAETEEVVHQDACEQQDDIDRLAPCIENERKHRQGQIFDCQRRRKPVAKEAYGQKQI